MFIGRYEVTLDPKGRVHLPAKVRDPLMKEFEPPLIVTIADRCLALFPKAQWLDRYEALEREPRTPEQGDLLRAVTENAELVEIKNGRILIPARLREYAGLEKDGVIIGRMSKFELWSAERHAALTATLPPDELSQRLRELGF
jgi:MraZ protein